MTQKASLHCLEPSLHEQSPRFEVRVPQEGFRYNLEILAQLLGLGHVTKCGPEGLALGCRALGCHRHLSH